MAAPEPAGPPRPARILPAIVLAQFAGTSVWFAGNAVLPDLQRDWGLPGSALAAVTSAVQLGFVVGTLVFALLNVADRFSARRVFLVSALAAAACNAAAVALPPFESRYAGLVALRVATGFFLAGIYPVGMRIAAGWYREGLGSALGWLTGALVVGTAFPHLLRGLGQELPWAAVTLAVSAVAAAGGLLLHALVPDGPHLPGGSRFDAGALAAIFRSRDFRASAGGYFGHMWELYTFWALTPVLLAAYAAWHGTTLNVALASFAVIAVGAVGCVGGGIASLRRGSAPVAAAQLAASGACCLALPLAFLAPPPAFLAFMLFWGIVVVGDSAQFSALTAATAPRERVGSALTLVTSAGFALTIASILATSASLAVLEARYAFVPVALGPALGLFAFRRLARAGR